MNLFRTTLAIALAGSMTLVAGTQAQNRDLGAQRVILDDGGPFRLTLQAPTLTANGTFTFPDPSTTSGSFVMTSSLSGQTITGPLSITNGNSSLEMATNLVVLRGRDVIGSDFPFVLQSDNAGLTYGVDTYGRMLRLEQVGAGFRDLGIDNFGNFFIGPLSGDGHSLELTPGGDLAVSGNITLGGTVDGIDIANADAANVKLTGNQVIFGHKTLAGPTVWMPQIDNLIGADNWFLTPLTSTLSINSDDATAANRTFTLANGTSDGQILVIRQWTNASQLEDSGNAWINGDMDFGPGDTIMLTWDSNLGAWLEISRSHN